jgi:transposase InsO family protein
MSPNTSQLLNASVCLATAASACQPRKRGWPAQQPQREAEREARVHAVDFNHWAMQQGVRQHEAAEQLGLAPGTLAYWDHRWHVDCLEIHPLGRRCHRAPSQLRNQAIDFMRCVGPGVSATAVQASFPKLARREAANLRDRFRHLWELDHQRAIHVLHWHQPGTVWAMDHSEPGTKHLRVGPIDDHWPHLFAVRDLASSCQLGWQPVLDETAETTIEALHCLFLEHGPPLVLKSDNGSGFIAEAMRRFLECWGVLPLFSPPYTPEYNGAIEAGNFALKTRTQNEAARQGRNGHWTADDAEVARRMANELTYPRGPLGPTRQECLRTSPPISLETRAAFGRTVAREQTQERLQQGYPLDTDLGHMAQAQIDRAAISRALVEHDYLTFTRRSITPSIKS